MPCALRASISYVLITMMSTGSIGIVLQHHYCRGQLMNRSLYFKPRSCHELERLKGQTCPFHQQQSKASQPADCCDDTSEYLNDDENKLIQISTIEDPRVQTGICTAEKTTGYLCLLSDKIPYLNHKPPLISERRYLRYCRLLC